ncbi:mCG1028112, isoform CRA_c [Mus musculus]|nr:mCG1028112, isoform CRA_c [Mus musculus]
MRCLKTSGHSVFDEEHLVKKYPASVSCHRTVQVPNPPSLLLTIDNSALPPPTTPGTAVPGGSDALFWPLWELHTGCAQKYIHSFVCLFVFSEFQDSQSYREKFCLENQETNKQTNQS